MPKKYQVVSVSLEMMIPELKEPARGALFRGGLGILIGDVGEGLARRDVPAIGIVPLYRFHWETGQEIFYGDSGAKYLFDLEFNMRGRERKVGIYTIDRGGTQVFGVEDRDCFNVLYVGDRWQRFQQEILIGEVVPVLLKKLGIKPDIFWLQEGHVAFAIPHIIEDPYFPRKKFLFTTHTPVPEGMEKFPQDWFGSLGLDGKYYSSVVKNGEIDMTWLAMFYAEYITGVSEEHGQVTRKMFPEFARKTTGIINGSSRDFWLSPNIKNLGDGVDKFSLWEANQKDKQELVDFNAKKTGCEFDSKKPTLGLVRRFAPYKNQYPMLDPIIGAICAKRGEVVGGSPFGELRGLGIQVFSAGRAHENDRQCQGWMAGFESWMKSGCFCKNFAFVPEYSLELLEKSARGCDFWLSCPWPGWEACGTSDMRSSFHGALNFATRTGGVKEYIKDFDPITGEGDGFFIDPYSSITLYQKLQIASDLYYAWLEKGDDAYLQLRLDIFEKAKQLDVVNMIRRYEKVFEKMV